MSSQNTEPSYMQSTWQHVKDVNECETGSLEPFEFLSECEDTPTSHS